MAAADFNSDGAPDLYLGVWLGDNRLFHNDGQGQFFDATTSAIADGGRAFGVAVGDVDNDGDLDIFQASGANVDNPQQPTRSLMLLNLGDDWLDVTGGVGLNSTHGLELHGPGLADIDNDGDLDLLVMAPHFLFLNDGQGVF